eukprot:55217-Eustigmatos_ZCMA.PRE.1
MAQDTWPASPGLAYVPSFRPAPKSTSKRRRLMTVGTLAKADLASHTRPRDIVSASQPSSCVVSSCPATELDHDDTLLCESLNTG